MTATLTSMIMMSCATGPGAGSPQEVAESTELLSRIYEQTWGDVADRRASDLLAYADTQGGYKECMAKEGYSYTPPPFDDPYLGKTRNGPPEYFQEVAPASVEEAQLQGFGIGDRAERLLNVAVARGWAPWEDPPNTGYTLLSPSAKQLYEAAGGRCGPPDFFGDGQEPPLADVFNRALHEVVSEVVRRPDVQDLTAGYPACMAAAGVPVADRTELIVELTVAFGEPVYVELSANWRTVATTPTWAELRAREQHAAVADAQCRIEVHALTMTLLKPRLEQFARDHAAEIQLLATQWAEVRAKAAKVSLPL